MTGIVIATGDSSQLAPLTERMAGPIIPVVDRPFLQHIVEYLVDQGVSRFGFVLSHLPEQIEEFLGDGKRWGSTFRFFLAREPHRPYKALLSASLDRDPGPVILVHADRLIQADLKSFLNAPDARLPVAFVKPDGSENGTGGGCGWTGWAMLSSAHIAAIEPEADEKRLAAQVLRWAHEEGTVTRVCEMLSAQTHQAILDAHRAVLAQKFPSLCRPIAKRIEESGCPVTSRF